MVVRVGRQSAGFNCEVVPGDVEVAQHDTRKTCTRAERDSERENGHNSWRDSGSKRDRKSTYSAAIYSVNGDALLRNDQGGEAC
jgi:hypothetical protein